MSPRTQEYTPSVPKGQPIEKLETPDTQVLLEAFNVGQAVQTASLRLRDKFPGWAAFWDQLYYQLDDTFKGES